jgi:hypothetical protein
VAGDAADDAYNAAMRNLEDASLIIAALRDGCPERCVNPEWFYNRDALFECKKCGRIVDL